MLVLLFRVVLKIDFGETWAQISAANPLFLLLATLAYYATFPLRGLRWRFVLGRVGTQIGRRDATEILFLSWFVNCLVPAKLGDLYRAYLLKGNYGGSISRTVGTIFIERIADIVVIFALALAAGFWSFRGRITPGDRRTLPGRDSSFAAILVLLVIGLQYFGGHLTRFLPERVADLYERFHEGSTGALTVRSLPVIGALTTVIWLFEGLRLFFVIRALELPGREPGDQRRRCSWRWPDRC